MLMQHTEAVRIKAVEQYLLCELSHSRQTEFEEHLIDCQECAEDLRIGALFLDVVKEVMEEEVGRVERSHW